MGVNSHQPTEDSFTTPTFMWTVQVQSEVQLNWWLGNSRKQLDPLQELNLLMPQNNSRYQTNIVQTDVEKSSLHQKAFWFN